MNRDNGVAMREKDYLRQRYRAIASYTGAIMALCGLLTLLPLASLIVSPEDISTTWAFGGPAAFLIVVGILLRCWLRPSHPVALTIQEGGVIVLVSWTIAVLFSAWPFMRVLKMDVTRSVFEAVSGWTTTGLSVVDVTDAPGSILLWRSIMQLAGGAGLAIIMMSAIVGPTGAGLSAAEGRSDQLVPHVGQSARLVLMIYSGYVAAGVLAYRLAGMSFFDAVNHAFAAVSTGGFSTRAQSIGYWNSTAVEAVTVPLMILGNLSFITAWMLLKGKVRFAARSSEVRFSAIVISLASVALFLVTSRELYPQLDKSMRVAIFETVTALTTTGFSTVGYGSWNSFGVVMLTALMLIGGGTCSTAGGIKQFRMYILFRLVAWELRRPFLPKLAVVQRPVWEADRKVFVDDARICKICAFVTLYAASFTLGTLILCAFGYRVRDCAFEMASALGTVGLSTGITCAGAPDAVLWTETVAMFLGRLEFFVIVVSAIKLMKDTCRMLLPSR